MNNYNKRIHLNSYINSYTISERKFIIIRNAFVVAQFIAPLTFKCHSLRNDTKYKTSLDSVRLNIK